MSAEDRTCNLVRDWVIATDETNALHRERNRQWFPICEDQNEQIDERALRALAINDASYLPALRVHEEYRAAKKRKDSLTAKLRRVGRNLAKNDQ